MQANKTYLFEYISLNHFFALLLFAFTNALLYYFGLLTILRFVLVTAIIVSTIIDPFLGISSLITSYLYVISVFSGRIQILLCIIIWSMFLIKNSVMIKNFKFGIWFIVSVIITIFSYFIGIDSDFEILVSMLNCLITVVIISNSKIVSIQKWISLLYWSYICAAISISAYISITFLTTGSVAITTGRISFNGNIKNVAVVMVVAIAFILFSALERKRMFRNIPTSIFSYILLFIFILILILTVARGVIVALGVSFVIFILFSKDKKKGFYKVFPIIFFAFIIIFIYIDNSSYRVSRLFNSAEYATMSGRTDIWLTHFNTVIESGPIHVLFGVGPGNIDRLNYTNSYAHSTFLDFFFSYGIVGFIAIALFEFKLLISFIKSKNAIIISMFSLSVVMYVTHSSSNNYAMFLMQIILVLMNSYFDDCKRNGRFELVK